MKSPFLRNELIFKFFLVIKWKSEKLYKKYVQIKFFERRKALRVDWMPHKWECEVRNKKAQLPLKEKIILSESFSRDLLQHSFNLFAASQQTSKEQKKEREKPQMNHYPFLCIIYKLLFIIQKIKKTTKKIRSSNNNKEREGNNNV